VLLDACNLSDILAFSVTSLSKRFVLLICSV
jgi:hypothetical protein